jgi:hypothetical protein
MRAIIPGIVALLISFVLTVIVGFYVGFNTQHDATLAVMMAMFVYTAPYTILAIVGVVLYHSKRWLLIAYTLDAGAIILLCVWLANNWLLIDSTQGWGAVVEESLLRNFSVSAVISTVVIVIMIIQGQIAWPDKQ